MTAVRMFPDESSMSHILRLMHWEWLEAGSQRSDLTSSNSWQKRPGRKDRKFVWVKIDLRTSWSEVCSSPKQRTFDDFFGMSGSCHKRTHMLRYRLVVL